MTVTVVTSAGGAMSFQHERDRVRVRPPRAFAAGDRFAFTVKYHGIPATGLLIAPNKYGDRSLASDSWPDTARNHLASIDHPSVKAPVTTIVTAPSHYQVVSNGLLIRGRPETIEETAEMVTAAGGGEPGCVRDDRGGGGT